jgi:glutaconyl-CoA decarboxylase
MRPYFEKMHDFGQPLSDAVKQEFSDSAAQILAVEKEVAAAVQKVKLAGFP